MNTIILRDTEHFRSIAIATGSLPDKTIFIIEEGQYRTDLPIKPYHLAEEMRDIQPMRKSTDQPWKKPWKR